MKKIQLGGHNKVNGIYQIRGYALVDDSDFDFINQWRWFLGSEGYATRAGKKLVLMHRLIKNTPKGFDTDHINRNKLDNREENLRIVTRSLNNFNSGIPRHNTSGYKGVTWNKKRQLWQAQIQINCKNHVLGLFKDIFEAIEISQKAEAVYAV